MQHGHHHQKENTNMKERDEIKIRNMRWLAIPCIHSVVAHTDIAILLISSALWGRHTLRCAPHVQESKRNEKKKLITSRCRESTLVVVNTLYSIMYTCFLRSSIQTRTSASGTQPQHKTQKESKVSQKNKKQNHTQHPSGFALTNQRNNNKRNAQSSLSILCSSRKSAPINVFSFCVWSRGEQNYICLCRHLDLLRREREKHLTWCHVCFVSRDELFQHFGLRALETLNIYKFQSEYLLLFFGQKYRFYVFICVWYQLLLCICFSFDL